jgi:hypothetical protein
MRMIKSNYMLSEGVAEASRIFLPNAHVLLGLKLMLSLSLAWQIKVTVSVLRQD